MDCILHSIRVLVSVVLPRSYIVCVHFLHSNSQDDWISPTNALIKAAENGHLECVRLLLELGAFKDATDHVRMFGILRFWLLVLLIVARLSYGFSV